MNIAWWVRRWSELQPLKPSIIFEDGVMSYSELHMRANATICWLQSIGIEKGDRVAVVLENCPDFIEFYLACSRLGAIFVPLSFRFDDVMLIVLPLFHSGGRFIQASPIIYKGGTMVLPPLRGRKGI